MKPLLVACLLLSAIAAIAAGNNRREPADYVNPFIDSHKSRWIFFSSACRPFGMVNLSPDTNAESPWKSGYMYDSTYIRCFSHIHAWEMSGVPVMPVVGEMNGHKGLEATKSKFSHEGEIARPGYHKVFLQTPRVWAEVTSTLRVGMHRYTFPKSSESYLIFDTGAYLANSAMDSSAVTQVSSTEIEGMSLMGPSLSNRRPKQTPVYFVAQFSKPMKAFGGWEQKQLLKENIKQVSGKDAGVYIRFDTREGEQVLVKVAISYTSVENARKNLKAELAHWDFDRVCRESYHEWNRELGKIAVEGGTEKSKVKLYTDLWHSLLGRRIVSDVDGHYLDQTTDERRIRKAPLKADGTPWPHHVFDSWWGSHWSLNILWSMAYPEIMDQFCNTMVSMYKDGGLIDRGAAGGCYTFVMIGDPSLSLFATAYNKGIRNYDTRTAYEGLRKNAFLGGDRDHAGYEQFFPATGGGMSYYLDKGYVPYDHPGKRGFHHNATSAMTLEYAYQDWCLAQMAKGMDKEADYRLFMERSKNYKNVWNPKTRWMEPRMMDGNFMPDFNPAYGRTEIGFCESSAAVYTHYVPHDIPGLIELFGGADKYIEQLNWQFEEGAKVGFRHKGESDDYWVQYTNQPGTGMAHIFNVAGQPWLSQKWVREVKEAYSDTTAYGGYYDDEDEGQMGALGVLMAIGLFQENGGCAVNSQYEITSPIFDRIEIKLDPRYYPGKTFVIVARNNSPENKYIQSAKLNGQPLHLYHFPHDTFARGGTLELVLGPTPNKQWGTGK